MISYLLKYHIIRYINQAGTPNPAHEFLKKTNRLPIFDNTNSC